MFRVLQRFTHGMNEEKDKAESPIHDMLLPYREVSRLSREDDQSSYIARSFQGELLYKLITYKEPYGEHHTLHVRGSIESLILEPVPQGKVTPTLLSQAEFDRFKSDIGKGHPNLSKESRIILYIMHALFQPSLIKTKKSYIKYGRERERDRVREVVDEIGQFCGPLHMETLLARKEQLATFISDEPDADKLIKGVFARIEVCSLKDIPGLIVLYRRLSEKDKRPANRD